MGLKLMAEVGVDGSGFEKGLHKLGHSAGHHLKGLVAGAFGVYSLHQAIHKTIESAEELVTASRRLDLTIEQLQVMRQAAKESGVQFGKLEGALEKINKAREKALMGDAKAKGAFAKFGVTDDDLRNKTAADIFSGPMSAAAKANNAQNLTGPGSAIFGLKAFGALLPVLKTDFEGLQGKMQGLGSIISTEAAVKIKIAAEEFGLLSNIVVAQLAPALGMIAPALLKFWGALQEVGAYLVGLVTNNDATAGDWMKTYAATLKYYATGKISTERNPAIDRVAGAVKNAQEDRAAAAAEQKKLQDAFAKHIAEMVERLKHPPKPEIPGPKPKKELKGGSLPETDSLLTVGNFLGSGSQLINSIAQQQLDEQRKTTAAVENVADVLHEVIGAIETNGDDTEVP